MSKRTILENVEDSLDWDEVEINELITQLNGLKENGATHILFEVNHGWGEPYVEVQAVKKRDETEQEYAKRQELENRNREITEEKERAELKRLQEKYCR